MPGWESYRAGQHIDVRLTAEDGYQATRSYSLASPPESGTRLQLMVERLDDGEVSPYLVDEVMPGDRLELLGPIGGHFVWEIAEGAPLQLISGGAGVVPLLAMVRHRATAGNRVPARLLYSARSIEEAIARDELARAGAPETSLTVALTLTRAAPAGWNGYRRQVDDRMLVEALFPSAERPLVYVCGPTGFVEAVADGLLRLDHPAAYIRTERFGPTGS